MAVRVNVNLSKKVGLPDYGSLGASCGVEFETSAELLQSDLDGFHQTVRSAYQACRIAVNDELARQQNNGTVGATDPASSTSASNGNGSTNANNHRATDKQLDYARQLAGQVRGLGIRKLEGLASKMFGKPVADLSTLDASGLIDMLKAIKGGQVKLEDALNGAAV